MCVEMCQRSKPSKNKKKEYSSTLFSLFLFPSTEIHKNVISPLEGDTKEPEIHKKHTDLKQKMRDLNHGFERLRKLSHEGFTEDSGEQEKMKKNQQKTSHVHTRHTLFGILIPRWSYHGWGAEIS